MKASKIQINSKRASPPAGPYSQGIAAGPFIFVAGQRPVDVNGKMGSDIKEQTRFCIENIKAILEEAGSSLADIVKSNIYLSDIGNFAAMNEVYREMIPEPYPARTTIGTMLRGILVEIEVIALRQDFE